MYNIDIGIFIRPRNYLNLQDLYHLSYSLMLKVLATFIISHLSSLVNHTQNAEEIKVYPHSF